MVASGAGRGDAPVPADGAGSDVAPAPADGGVLDDARVPGRRRDATGRGRRSWLGRARLPARAGAVACADGRGAAWSIAATPPDVTATTVPTVIAAATTGARCVIAFPASARPLTTALPHVLAPPLDAP
jgi:hypothetical protein